MLIITLEPIKTLHVYTTIQCRCRLFEEIITLMHKNISLPVQ